MNVMMQQRLRELREEAGISQEKLAMELGVTRMTLAGYELGKRSPDGEFIVKVANFFECSPDYIFGVSPFKNQKHYEEWISSADTLKYALTMLPAAKRKDLVIALNWLLQDNSTMNIVTADKDYVISQYISLTLSFTRLFQKFAEVIDSNASNREVDRSQIFAFYQDMEKVKSDILATLNKATDDLLRFLLASGANQEVLSDGDKEE